MYTEYEQTGKKTYAEYQLTDECKVCKKVTGVDLMSIDLLKSYFDLITNKDYSSFLFKLLEDKLGIS